jgi:hypothetical protein
MTGQPPDLWRLPALQRLGEQFRDAESADIAERISRAEVEQRSADTPVVATTDSRGIGGCASYQTYGHPRSPIGSLSSQPEPSRAYRPEGRALPR